MAETDTQYALQCRFPASAFRILRSPPEGAALSGGDSALRYQCQLNWCFYLDAWVEQFRVFHRRRQCAALGDDEPHRLG